MRPIGFSTGAVARGDFAGALSVLEQLDSSVVELSALRESELPALVDALGSIPLAKYKFVSFHAPASFDRISEREGVQMLLRVLPFKFPIVVHPSAIHDPAVWEGLGGLLYIENQDARKSSGRTVEELEPLFDKLPQAKWCFDLAHARQMDRTMTLAERLIRTFSNKLELIHISEVDQGGNHLPLSQLSMSAIRKIAPLLPSDIPAVLEATIDLQEMPLEIELAQIALSSVRKAEVA